jgi:hypothetical protein
MVFQPIYIYIYIGPTLYIKVHLNLQEKLSEQIMVKSFVSLSSLGTYKMEWGIKVRVLGILVNKTDSADGNVNTIDLILLDSEVYT